MRCQNQIQFEQKQKCDMQEGPFDIIKGYRSILLKKRRKLLRTQNKLMKLRRDYQRSISKKQLDITHTAQVLKNPNSEYDDQWDAFLDDSQNLKKESLSTDFFPNGLNHYSSQDSMLDQQFNLFHNSAQTKETIVKFGLYAQKFTQFYYDSQV